jgi:hypothetical protein
VLRGRARFVVEAGIERRLSATGLVQRDLHVVAKPLEHAHDGEADFGSEFVDEAGVEELDGGHRTVWSVGSVGSVGSVW